MVKFIALLLVLTYSSLCLADPLTCDTQTDVPAADNEAYFYRPCSDFDRTCVAEYLGAHSNCTLNIGSISEPHYRAQSNTYFPSFNMSMVQNAVYISGLNGEIVEFYHNNVTDKLVIAVHYANLIVNSTTARISFHRTASEPAVTLGSSDEHIIATITVVFDDVSGGLDINKSYAHAYLPVLPEVSFPDTITSYPADQDTVTAMWTEFGSNLPVVFQEGMHTASLYYFWSFTQNFLCDFDISEYK